MNTDPDPRSSASICGKLNRYMKAIVFFTLVVLIGASVAFSQTNVKLIAWQEKPLGSNNEQWKDAQLFRVLDRLEIESVSVGKPVTMGQSFTADDDWLKNVVIRVRNTSGQQISTIQVTLVLPEMGPGSPDVVYCYGCAQDERAKGIAPGDAVDVKMLNDLYYDFVKQRAAEKGGIAQINKAEIRTILVTLPDKTRWVSGCIKTTDARNACPVVAQ